MQLIMCQSKVSRELRMWCSSVALLVTFALAAEESETFECRNGAYPPSSVDLVERFVVDLDRPPTERWEELARKKSPEIQALREGFRSVFGAKFIGDYFLRLTNRYMGVFVRTLPAPYAEEIASVAKFANVTVEEATLFNLFYEFFSVCTSIVATDAGGRPTHGRNMDFGLFLGWNSKLHSWRMTELLRATVVELEWQRNNRTLFRSVNFAGYVGVLTGMKAEVFSLTIDIRFKLNGGYLGLIQWLAGARDIAFAGFVAREVLENNNTYSDAVQSLSNAKLIAPIYFIVGGTQSREGVVLTKERNIRTASRYTMVDNERKFGEDWFVLATNYDLDGSAPFFDDRMTPAATCLSRLGKAGVGKEGLFNVLSTDPNLNRLTVYTTLMQVKPDSMETYIQRCYNCSLW